MHAYRLKRQRPSFAVGNTVRDIVGHRLLAGLWVNLSVGATNFQRARLAAISAPLLEVKELTPGAELAAFMNPTPGPYRVYGDEPSNPCSSCVFNVVN